MKFEVLFFRPAYVSASAFNKLRRLEYKGYLFGTSSCRLMRLFSREPANSSRGRKSFRYYHQLSNSKSRWLFQTCTWLACLRFESRLRVKSTLLTPLWFGLNRGSTSVGTINGGLTFHATTFNNSPLLCSIPSSRKYNRSEVNETGQSREFNRNVCSASRPLYRDSPNVCKSLSLS